MSSTPPSGLHPQPRSFPGLGRTPRVPDRGPLSLPSRLPRLAAHAVRASALKGFWLLQLELGHRVGRGHYWRRTEPRFAAEPAANPTLPRSTHTGPAARLFFLALCASGLLSFPSGYSVAGAEGQGRRPHGDCGQRWDRPHACVRRLT